MGVRRQELAIVVALLVIGSLLIEFWLGSSADGMTLGWVQGAWVAGIILGAWLRVRHTRRS